MTDAANGRCRGTDDDQCRGTVIIHSRWGSECTEPDCDGLELTHAYRIDCDAVGCYCIEVTARAI